MTFPDTRPFCGQCGWAPDNSGLGDIGDDKICDSCGADLNLYGFALEGPENPPSVPNANAGDEQVTFQWTASPTSFPGGYDFRYNLDGGAYTIVSNATSPQVIPAAAGVEVCGSLRGYKNGIASDWSTDDCATAQSSLVCVPSGIPPAVTPSTGFFTFSVNGDNIDTPHTSDLSPAGGVYLYVDGSILWEPATANDVVGHSDGFAGYSMYVQASISSGVQLSYIMLPSIGTFKFQEPVNYTRHVVELILNHDCGTREGFVDGVSVLADTFDPYSVKQPYGGTLIIGSPDAVIDGDFYRAIVGDEQYGILADMNADDGGFPAGPVADGSTFTSNGRVWTVHGTGVSYTPPPPA